MPDWFDNSPSKVKLAMCLAAASAVGFAVGTPYLAYIVLAVAFVVVLGA